MSASVRCVAVIEDERDLVEVLRYNLEREGFRVVSAMAGADGIELVRAEQPDVILLDLMLPGMDGIEVCSRLRADSATAQIPVIMLTAKDAESDVVLGLGVGADDYVTKPFSPRELVARVKAVLRRNERVAAGGESPSPSGDNERVEVPGLIVDLGRHEVLVNGEIMSFTKTELRMLFALMSRPGRVLSRERLIELAVGEDAYILDRTVDVHIKSIRKKLADRADALETVRGVGYRFNDRRRPAAASSGPSTSG